MSGLCTRELIVLFIPYSGCSVTSTDAGAIAADVSENLISIHIDIFGREVLGQNNCYTVFAASSTLNTVVLESSRSFLVSTFDF